MGNRPPHIIEQVTKAYTRINQLVSGKSSRLAEIWLDEEDKTFFHIGVPDFSTAVSTIYAVEAARALCAVDPVRARKLLVLAISELPDADPQKR